MVYSSEANDRIDSLQTEEDVKCMIEYIRSMDTTVIEEITVDSIFIPLSISFTRYHPQRFLYWIIRSIKKL